MQQVGNESDKKNKSNKDYLLQYGGLAFQLFVLLFVAVFLGHKIDGWIPVDFPLFIWFLPILFITGMIIKIYRDTSQKK
jgi:hypothetical protein